MFTVAARRVFWSLIPVVLGMAMLAVGGQMRIPGPAINLGATFLIGFGIWALVFRNRPPAQRLWASLGGGTGMTIGTGLKMWLERTS